MAEPSSSPATGSSAVGAAPLTDDAPALGNGRYRLVRLIATGGMAEVWEAIDTVLTRPVAVKVLLPHLARDDAFVRRFRQEAVAAAQLSHPHIVALFDTCSDDDDSQAIVMELVRGPTLRQVLDAEHQLSPARVVSIGAQVADALHHAHRNGLIHRDVKPGNILSTADGRLLVADFGIAKAAEASADLTEVGQVVGTAKYLSPEQVEGHPLDARSDVYSLGVVLYEALCGRPPFNGDAPTATALARLTTKPVPPRQIRPDIPRALEDAVLTAMARRPGDRHRSAAHLRAALLAVDPSLVGEYDGDVTTAAPLDTTTTIDATSTGTVSAGATSMSTVPAPGPTGATPEADSSGVAAFAHQERSWIVPAVLIVIIAATIGIVGVLLGRTEVADDLRDVVRDPPPLVVDDQAVELAGAPSSFDPVGGDGENEESLAALTDGDPTTSWSTERYDTRGFGGLKDGVGIVIPLRGSASLDRLEVTSPTQGWAAEVYVADQIPDDLAGWGEPVADAEDIHGSANFDLGGTSASMVLLWFDDLGDGTVGSRFSVEVDEVTVSG